jgi:hypothetical protein
MDFITSLPKSQGYDVILVMVDRVSKLAHIVPTRRTATALETAKIIPSAWWNHGLPRVIVSNQDPKFTSAFLKHFFKNVRTKLTFSTAFHPQTDGQIERVNGILNQYLRNFVSADQRDWVDYVELAEFSYNVATHSATKESPFKVAYGVEPLHPADLALEGVHSILKFNKDGEDLPRSGNTCWKRQGCCWKRQKGAMRSKSMPKDVCQPKYWLLFKFCCKRTMRWHSYTIRWTI